jgi:hypothetical protein
MLLAKVEWSSHMMMNRRIFVHSAALVGAAPVVANLLLLSSRTKSHEFLQTEPILGQDTTVYSGTNSGLFKIDGWDRGTGTSNDRQTVIRLTQSWRTAWR